MEHKLITGGEQWLPFARSRIKALRATGAHMSQKFEIEGALIDVRIDPGHGTSGLRVGHKRSASFSQQAPELNPNAGVGGAAADRLNNPAPLCV